MLQPEHQKLATNALTLLERRTVGRLHPWEIREGMGYGLGRRSLAPGSREEKRRLLDLCLCSRTPLFNHISNIAVPNS